MQLVEAQLCARPATWDKGPSEQRHECGSVAGQDRELEQELLTLEAQLCAHGSMDAHSDTSSSAISPEEKETKVMIQRSEKSRRYMKPETVMLSSL